MPEFSRILPLVVASALFMENMDSTVIATSLPAIAAHLSVDPVVLKLAFTTYLLGLTVFIPISGWCADRFGARNVFRLAIAVFTVASLACGFASSLGWLVAARGLQGIGGAMMVPVGRLILLRTVPKSRLVDALAYLTIPALIGPLVGPPLGGFITTYFDWRWIFWINLPIGLLGIALASALMPAITAERVPPLDFRGFLLSGLGLAALVFGLTLLGRELLPGPLAPVLVGGGAVLLILYGRHARGRLEPILDLKLLKLPTFRAAVLGGSLFRIGVGAIPFLLPLMLQLGFGLSPFKSGLMTCAAAAGALAMKFTAARILRRFGFRSVLIANTAIAAAFVAVNGLFTPATPFAAITALLIAGGFFRSLQFTSLNALAYSDIAQARLAPASSLASVAQQLSLTAGVALAAAVLEAARSLRADSAIAVADFHVAFIAVSLVSVASLPWFLKLPAEAGAEVSGRRAVAGE